MEESEKEPTSLQDGVIRWLGECIFPQPFSELDKKYGLEILLKMANQGLIIKSNASVGLSPLKMKNIGGYVELSEKGWEEYERLKAV